MPVFGLCYLWDAMATTGEKGPRPREIRRRVLNAILPEGGTSHVEELSDPYLLWFWNSNTRTTAIALESVLRNQAGDQATKSLKAGDLVQVRLTLSLTKERSWVAVMDPIPAGFEPVESWFNTTSTELAQNQKEEESGGSWLDWWQKGGFDHVERHDDRVMLFATRLAEGRHSFRYVCRATTAGTFRTAPAHVEEMYEPEVFGRTATDVVNVNP
jgi:uncharacterized protein YfaS (alpha-2-macroglobulin family)